MVPLLVAAAAGCCLTTRRRPQHAEGALLRSRRTAVTAAAAALVPWPAASKLLQPEVTWAQQAALMREHAARFEDSTPAAVRRAVISGRRIRELVATADLPANTRVAAYPVEVVSDEDEHDDTYAVELYREGVRGERAAVPGVAGIPTEASLARAYVDGLPTIAMFANEPDAEHEPNCLFIFPTVSGRGRRVRLGDVHYGYLQTVTGVRRGAALTWCYGPSYVDRGYPTTCGPS